MTPNVHRAEFAQWLEATHPDVFEAMYPLAREHVLKGLSGLGDVALTDVTSSLDAALDNISFSAGTDINAALALQDFGETLSTPTVPVSPSGTSSSGGVLSALSSVGSWLTSGGGLNALANLGTQVLKTQATADQAKVQMAVIQAQAARVQAGQSPAPIAYVNGQPVYTTGGGQYIPAALEQAIQNGTAHPVTLADGTTGYTLDHSTLSSVLSTGVPWWIWLIGGGFLLLAFFQRQSS